MNIDIKKVAKLSRLKISEQDIPKFERDMQSIVDMVDKLPDVSDLTLSLDRNDPMVLREDVIGASVKRTDMLKNAPQVEAGCFVVPKVVEE
ncbi:Asp-tRNA(Asn)/Glu-tRNA(Gln) amidotransferase subunit GatC [Acetanaerobacterium elongatum]|uniref:Aspartyl/glutamyl-tRNA(Asn/Gln) amidotransferase subunit C n=1 Tax=Acetanaerobacterium elongatum TaxID=258515 RepID=A0A1H0ATD9_9FIRM|nr:Asp-tRNA(Asn)/Glu-tRNA(Gln) amidotransferase subunit GatC [Acetanaerobacterium elongatum]SDN36595.1 aspartyl/glutamyl-tRNA(Asn/Gln) amidotransferase subunit C [Acetanaerobacterium elongatum]